ncbi:plasmid mobilization protein [Oribacterium sp. NK2B42]|uniref:plasmid mobilization protein n=1 Tax=Oribacterium sp. NK2B42 TaxID=689781 RepID=UPI0003F521E3|nr:hypothetical protein [Oribacterium sp. NK2B42]
MYRDSTKVQVHVYVTRSEKKLLKELAAAHGLNVSNYFKMLAYNDKARMEMLIKQK